jgi:hypothetical protein
VWNARIFAPVIHAKGIIPGDPIVMGGGLTETSEGPPPAYAFSVGFWMSYDQGIHWQRPECTLVANCNYPLPVADTFGSCIAEYSYYKHCFVLPDTPALAGSMGADWDRYWLFYEAEDNPVNQVYHLGAADMATGWQPDEGSTDGGFGRKVFIRGSVFGSGCWFSTDYEAEDLWIFLQSEVQSMNFFATAQSATGPWVNWNMTLGVTAPWDPRASAALVTGAFICSSAAGCYCEKKKGAFPAPCSHPLRPP